MRLARARAFIGGPKRSDSWPSASYRRILAGQINGAQVVERPSDGIESSIRSLGSAIEDTNPGLAGVFTKALLSGLERIDFSLLRAWAFNLSQLSRISVDQTIFGTWLSGKLSETAMVARGEGESTTPPSVARLMVELAEIEDGASVFDPCCGVGTILAAVAERAQEKNRSVGVYGQELKSVSWALCRLRLFLLGQDPSSIALGDSLRHPAFTRDSGLRAFDRVLCDAPIGLSLRDTQFGATDPYQRFIFSVPGRGHADNAFVQHALASMKPDGRAILLVSHGFLFRSGSDARVREGLLYSNLVQSVIGLPAKLLPMTAIETALLVLGKNVTGKIAVVDASNVQPLGRGKLELSPESIQHIVRLVRSPNEVESGLVCKVSAEDPLSNEFNLVPRRYVSVPDPTWDPSTRASYGIKSVPQCNGAPNRGGNGLHYRRSPQFD